MTDRDWYTTAEAAAALGITHAGIQQAIRRGTLTPTRIHPRLSIITADELERYRRAHLGRQGRHPALDHDRM